MGTTRRPLQPATRCSYSPFLPFDLAYSPATWQSFRNLATFVKPSVVPRIDATLIANTSSTDAASAACRVRLLNSAIFAHTRQFQMARRPPPTTRHLLPWVRLPQFREFGSHSSVPDIARFPLASAANANAWPTNECRTTPPYARQDAGNSKATAMDAAAILLPFAFFLLTPPQESHAHLLVRGTDDRAEQRSVADEYPPSQTMRPVTRSCKSF